jgi:hypothetical protein
MHFGHEESKQLSNIELAEAALNSQQDTFFIFDSDSGSCLLE